MFFLVPYPMACGFHGQRKTLKEKTGVIYSEGFPNNYTDGVDCSFSIEVISATSITLTFESFNLGESQNCSADYVEVFDGAYSSVSPSLGKFCGKDIPAPVTATAYGHMLVKFVTNGKGQFPGFKASYKCKCEYDTKK